MIQSIFLLKKKKIPTAKQTENKTNTQKSLKKKPKTPSQQKLGSIYIKNQGLSTRETKD